MSDFENASNHQAPQSNIPADNANAAWRRIFKRAIQQSMWRRTTHNQMESSESVTARSSSPRSRKGIIAFAVVILLLLGVPIAIFARLASHRTHSYKQGRSVVARGESLLGMNHATAIPKPSPYKYTLDTPITRPSNPIVFTPPRLPNSAAAVAPQTPTQTAPVTPALPQVANTLPSPAATTAAAKAPFTPIVYPARHEKHFGGCSGQLTLNAAGLNFRCTEDPGDSIQVALAEIGAIDENGIQTLSGKKYHFSIAGMSKPAAQQLFTNWLHQVR
jgi:hypothetical protein